MEVRSSGRPEARSEGKGRSCFQESEGPVWTSSGISPGLSKTFSGGVLHGWSCLEVGVRHQRRRVHRYLFEASTVGLTLELVWKVKLSFCRPVKRHWDFTKSTKRLTGLATSEILPQWVVDEEEQGNPWSGRSLRNARLDGGVEEIGRPRAGSEEVLQGPLQRPDAVLVL